MNPSKDVKDFTDLELAELSGQLYTQLIQTQNNLTIINQEIKNRKEKPAEKPKGSLKG